MEKFRQKPKKDKPMKHVETEKPPIFITDVKALKENLKIKEILRTVKMNSSMRIKAPRGSKVMQNKDFNDNEDIFDSEVNNEDPNSPPPSATNPDVVVGEHVEVNDEVTGDFVNITNEAVEEIISQNNDNIDTTLHESSSLPEGLSDVGLISEEHKQRDTIPDVKIDFSPKVEPTQVNTRDRKLSLDQTMLSRRGGLSQSELDLNSIGKSPLERKSSFFRKKMDSFLKNTTELFRKQSMSRAQPMSRRGSMSVSLQSLNENSVCNGDYTAGTLHRHQEELQSSVSSLQSSLSMSERTLPDPHSETDSLAGSRPVLTGSQPLCDLISDSAHSLNESYIQEAMLNSRAISMSSGLDSATGQSRRKANRTNRVTWLASEGLTNYLRRVIQDEKSREIQSCHSYQDFSTIPENNAQAAKPDRSRRLSYHRAVSGDDPRYYESTLNRVESSIRRKQLIPENIEANFEIADRLAEFSRNGLPELRGFCIANIPDEAFAYLLWAERGDNLDEFFEWKALTSNEEARQAVIKELVSTEADYIRHLLVIAEVFMATAHAIQDAGKLLDVDTEKLFTNIPDVLNASLYFWETTMYPMVKDAVENHAPFNTELMAPGFSRYREMFEPVEKYVNEQTRALDYLRSLANNADFMTYLTWCHGHRACNRLQLSDIMAKPMQRLTKYSILLRRIMSHTETEPERSSLAVMDTYAKNYSVDLNRSIRQREEIERLEQLACSVEAYEIDFRDEDMDRYFRLYAQTNLRAPMLNCPERHSRCVIYQGDLRFKDRDKELEVKVFLLTDMLLICKKNSKGSLYPYKLIRPKFMIDRMVSFPRYSTRVVKEVAGQTPPAPQMQSLVFVMVDDVGSSYTSFILSESSKTDSSGGLRTWELKFREAKLTYDLTVWVAKNPLRDISEIDFESTSDFSIPSCSRSVVKTAEEICIEREARERVAAMMYRSSYIDSSTDYDFSMATDSFDGDHSTSGNRPPQLQTTPGLRHPMKRTSTGGSSRNSRLSSFHQSTSAASHDEPQPGPSRYIYRAGSSVEHVLPSLSTDDGTSSGPSPSITVNVVSESESETVVLKQQQPPMLVLQQSSPHKTPTASRSPSSSRNTLRVQPQNVVMALVHSLPDLTIDPSQAPPRPQHVASPQSASEKLYQSHQELLQRNRLSALQHQHYLTPDHRGTSYPPPSPTRASLKRGLAFSYSFKNPPLSKMGHVNSQSQVQAEGGPSITHGPPPPKEKSPEPGPSKSTDKTDKKSKLISTRNKGGSASPSAKKDDKGD